MDITIEELLKGKATKIKSKEYKETEAYVTPFLERLEKLKVTFEVKVQLPEQITVTKEGGVNFDDITYNRVWIQGILPSNYCVENHDEVIGMVYGLDTRKPIVKFYRGGLNKACTNLCVFSPQYLSVSEFDSESPIDYRKLDDIIEKTYEIEKFLRKLKETVFTANDKNINEHLGRWIRKSLDTQYNNGVSKVKLATSTAIDAYKLLFEDDESPYFLNVGEETDYFNIYNAFTELISNKDKDIVNKCEKTLLLKSILDIH